MDSNGHDGLTPTPSTPGSPSTPKSLSHNDAYPSVRISDPFSTKSKDPAWEMITIGKPLEPGDIMDDALLHESDIDDESWLSKSKPQVAIARSISVTRANKPKISVQQYPIRVSSVSIKAPRDTRTAPQPQPPPLPGSRMAVQDGRRNELRREILGDRGFSAEDETLKEKKAMVPVLHLVDEGVNRKSVWGQIESV
jgi:hypothetical protein